MSGEVLVAVMGRPEKVLVAARKEASAPTPDPMALTLQPSFRPTSLLQSRRSLGGGGTPIWLDYPGLAWINFDSALSSFRS